MKIQDLSFYEQLDKITMDYNTYLQNKNYDLLMKKSKMITFYRLKNAFHEQDVEFVIKEDQISEIFFGKYSFIVEQDLILEQYPIEIFVSMIINHEVFIIRRLNNKKYLESEDYYLNQVEYDEVITSIKAIKPKLFKTKHYYEAYDYQSYALLLK